MSASLAEGKCGVRRARTALRSCLWAAHGGPGGPPLLRRVSRCALSQTLVPANGLALLGCVPGLCFRDYWFIVSNEEQIVPVTLWFI